MVNHNIVKKEDSQITKQIGDFAECFCRRLDVGTPWGPQHNVLESGWVCPSGKFSAYEVIYKLLIGRPGGYCTILLVVIWEILMFPKKGLYYLVGCQPLFSLSCCSEIDPSFLFSIWLPEVNLEPSIGMIHFY